MPKTISIEVEQVDKITNLLKSLPQSVERKAGRSIYKKAASKHLTPAARQKVPVDEKVLYKSIGSVNLKASRDKDGIGIFWGVRINKSKFPAWHAHLVERGTKPHQINFKNKQKIYRKGKKIFVNRSSFMHPGTSPQPFIAPAWNDNKDKVTNYIGNELASTLTKFINKSKK